MSKRECPGFFLQWLREQTLVARTKMRLLQEQDPCSVPAEFETLINQLDDFWDQVRDCDVRITATPKKVKRSCPA